MILEKVILLRHVVLSLNGLLEYGSPVRPRVMEAEIIHMIDNLDASMMMMTTALPLLMRRMTNKVSAMGQSVPSQAEIRLETKNELWFRQ